jgi:D-alanyl-D-alanine carboxypeptidase
MRQLDARVLNFRMGRHSGVSYRPADGSTDHFDEVAALKAVLEKHPRLSTRPGSRYAYSNIGYWLLGEIVKQAAGETLTCYVVEHVFRPLAIPARDLSYSVAELSVHAQG